MAAVQTPLSNAISSSVCAVPDPPAKKPPHLPHLSVFTVFPSISPIWIANSVTCSRATPMFFVIGGHFFHLDCCNFWGLIVNFHFSQSSISQLSITSLLSTSRRCLLISPLNVWSHETLVTTLHLSYLRSLSWESRQSTAQCFRCLRKSMLTIAEIGSSG